MSVFNLPVLDRLFVLGLAAGYKLLGALLDVMTPDGKFSEPVRSGTKAENVDPHVGRVALDCGKAPIESENMVIALVSVPLMFLSLLSAARVF